MEEGTGRVGQGKGKNSKILKLGIALLALLLVGGVLSGLSQSVPRPEAQKAAGPERPAGDPKLDLSAQQPFLRAQAVVAIAQTNAREFIPELRRMLREDTSHLVRGAAAVALGNFQDVESTSRIASMLKEDREVSPDILLDALGRMKDKAGARAVTPFLSSDNDVLRLQAVEALVEMKAYDQGDEILRLARGNQDMEKAKNFATALGKLKVTKAEDYLLRLARETPASPTLAASYLALGRITSIKAIPTLSDAMGKDFLKGRENAVEALIAIKSPLTLPYMFPYLSHSDKSIGFGAAEVISVTPDPTSGPKLLALLDGRDRNPIGPAVYALGRLKYKPARARIEALLIDKSSPEREIIARALGWMGGKESVGVLVATLRETDGEGRYGAAWSLGVLEAEEAVEDLKKAANSRDRKLAMLSVEALGMIHSEKTLPFLIDLVRKEPEFAAVSLSAIVAIPGRDARIALEKFAGHRDVRISRAAVQALAQRKDKDSVPALIALIEPSEPELRKQIYFALSSITGNKFSTATEWNQWYQMTRAGGDGRPSAK